jgi:hypothetical protein
MKLYAGMEVLHHTFLMLALKRGESPAPHPAALPPGKASPTPPMTLGKMNNSCPCQEFPACGLAELIVIVATQHSVHINSTGYCNFYYYKQ